MRCFLLTLHTFYIKNNKRVFHIFSLKVFYWKFIRYGQYYGEYLCIVLALEDATYYVLLWSLADILCNKVLLLLLLLLYPSPQLVTRTEIKTHDSIAYVSEWIVSILRTHTHTEAAARAFMDRGGGGGVV